MFTRQILKPLALAAAFAAASGSAFAQTAPAPADSPYGQSAAGPAGQTGQARHGHRLDRMLGTLGLSSDQQAKIRAYRASYRASRSTVKPETRKELMTHIHSVLTPDQLARLKAQMQQQRHHMDAAQTQ